jgi:hypothetical protein
VRVEFAFDIDEIAKHRFAPSGYLSQVGLRVATPLLARSFFETYGLHLNEVLGKGRRRPTMTGYRFSVRHFLPRIAYAETVLHRHRMPADVDDAEFDELRKALAQSDLENGWDRYRKHAGIGTYALAGLIYVLPPVGPLALLRIKGPESSTEQAYVRSVNESNATIRRMVEDLASRDAAQFAGDLPNRDLDTGLKVAPGTYRLTDETYAALLHRITLPGYGRVPAGLLADVRAFYANPEAPIATKKNPKKWAEVQRELALLPGLPTVPEP